MKLKLKHVFLPFGTSTNTKIIYTIIMYILICGIIATAITLSILYIPSNNNTSTEQQIVNAPLVNAPLVNIVSIELHITLNNIYSIENIKNPTFEIFNYSNNNYNLIRSDDVSAYDLKPVRVFQIGFFKPISFSRISINFGNSNILNNVITETSLSKIIIITNPVNPKDSKLFKIINLKTTITKNNNDEWIVILDWI